MKQQSFLSHLPRRTTTLVNNDKPVDRVFVTSDYTKFRTLSGNRSLNCVNRNRIFKSMSTNLLYTIVVVNEKFEVIDGQHRIDCLRELKKPIHYVIREGYGLDEVHILNANAKNWTGDDFMNGFADLGYPEYIALREFRYKYNLDLNAAVLLTTGKRVKAFDLLSSGAFKITQKTAAVKFADHLKELQAYNPLCKGRTFIYALYTIQKHDEFDWMEFKHKVKLNPRKIHQCATTEQYIEMFEQLYNYRRILKVSFRYLEDKP
jgi:hypothetical protein